MRCRSYNIDNLKPFTTDNASYYGSIGGVASGKSRLAKKIQITKKVKKKLLVRKKKVKLNKKQKKIWNYLTN